jgi:hypothetical protein
LEFTSAGLPPNTVLLTTLCDSHIKWGRSSKIQIPIYRLPERDGGYNWADRYPWIVEAALKNRHRQFVIDGEAVALSS